MAFARPDRSVDRFDRDPERSFTLAASYYIDPDVYDAEKRAIFQRNWLYVGHVSQVAGPGDYLTADLAGQQVFVVRDADGNLHSYFNVCLHRGHALLEGAGTLGRTITCPYHAWAYAPDGRLVGARMADRMEDFDFEDYRLPEVAVEDFCGFIFVNLDPDPPSMAEVYPGAAEALRELCPDPGALRVAEHSVFDIAANWKNVGDNLLECYHCHPAHPGFVELIDMGTYRNETFENWSLQSGRHRVADTRTTDGVYPVADGTHGFATLFMWPNIALGYLPGQRGLLVFQFEPTAAEATHQTLTWLTPDGELSATERDGLAWFNDVLGPEDVALVESVQVGLNSLGYHQGRFICIPDRPEISEHAVHHFHQLVLDALA